MSNPIQQQIDKVAEKWNNSKENDNLKLIRFFRGKQDKELIDSFFLYMLGVDTPINDIAFVFETSFKNPAQFSKELVKELEALIDEWNHSNKEGIEHFDILWKADYTNRHPRNSAGLFLDNFKNLVDELELSSKVFAVAIFSRLDIYQNPKALTWLEDAMQLMMHKNIRLVIEEDQNQSLTQGLKERWKSAIGTIWCEFNLDNAMEQIAGMGDPNDPSTDFRLYFLKLFKAIEKRKKEEVKEYSEKCLKIATRNLSKDINWTSQIVTVYLALAGDQVGHNHKGRALELAGSANQVAINAKDKMPKELGYRLIGQTYMYKGTLLYSDNSNKKALENFEQAVFYYRECEDVLFLMESHRMAAYVLEKMNEKKREFQHLISGFQLHKKLTPEALAGTSFPYLVKQLTETGHEETPVEEIEQVMTQLYGVKWREAIKNPKKYYKQNYLN